MIRRSRGSLKAALIYAPAAVVLSLAAAFALLHTAPVRRYALQVASDSLREGAGLDLTANELRYSLLSGAVSIDGLRLASTATPDLPPLLTADRLDANLSLQGLLAGRVVIESGTIEKPAIRLITNAAGRPNWPSSVGDSGTEESGADVRIVSFEARDADLVLDAGDGGVRIELPAWNAAVRFRGPGEHIVTVATSASGQFSLAGRTFDLGSVQLEAGLSGRGLDLRSFNAASGDLALNASGTIAEFIRPELTVSAAAALDTPPLSFLVDESWGLRGGFRAEATIDGSWDDLAVAATTELADLAYRDLEDVQVASRWRWSNSSGELAIEELTVRSPDGNADLDGRLALLQPSGASRLGARFSDLRLQRLGGLLEAPAAIAGLASGEAEFSGEGLAIERWTGSVRARVQPTRVDPAEGVLPVRAALGLQIGRDGYRLGIDSIEAFRSRWRGAVTLTRGGALSGQLQGEAEDLGATAEAARLFQTAASQEAEPADAMLTAGLLEASTSLGGTIDNPTFVLSVAGSGIAVGELRDVDAQLDLRGDRSGIEIDRGELTWRDQRIEVTGAIDLPADGPQLDLSAETRGASVAALGQALGEEVRLDGSFDLTARVTGAADSPEASLNIEVRDLEAAEKTWGDLRAVARFADDNITVDELLLEQSRETAAVRLLTASGNYGTADGRYAFTVEAAGLDVEGAAFDGTTLRGVVNLRAAGERAADGLEANATIEANDFGIGDQNFGDLTVSMNARGDRLEWTAGAPQLSLTATGALQMTEPYGGEAEIRADRTDLATLGLPPVSGRELSGTITSVLRVQGELANWEDGSAQVAISEIELHGGPVTAKNEGEIGLAYSGRELRVEQAAVAWGDSRIEAQGALPLEAGSSGELRVSGNLDLGQTFALLPPEAAVGASGRVEIDGALRGSLREVSPSIVALMKGAAFYTPGMLAPLTSAQGELKLENGVLEARGFSADWAGSRILLDASAPLALAGVTALGEAPDTPLRAQWSVSGLIVDSLIDMPADVGGSLNVSGNLTAPRAELSSIEGQVRFDELKLNYRTFQLVQASPSLLVIRDGRVNVDSLELIGPSTVLRGSGGASLAEDQTIDAQIEGEIDAAAFSLPWRTVRTAGQATVSFRASGPLASPNIEGTVLVSDGSAASTSPRLGASGLDIALRMTGDRVTVERFSGSLNGGSLAASGSLGYASGEITDVDLAVEIDDVFLSDPEGFRSVVQADLSAKTQPDESIVVGGTVRIGEGAYSDPVTLDRLFLNYLRAGSSAELVSEPNPLLSRIRYNVKIDSAEPLVVDNNLARLGADVNVRLVGTYTRPSVTGRMALEEGGELYLNENRYFVERGTVDFLSENRIEPSVDILARTQVNRKYDIDLTITGGGSQEISTQLSSPSHPELGEPDLISLLLTGRKRDELSGQEVSLAAETSLSLLTGSLSARLSSAAQETLGLSEVRIDPNLVAAESDPGARLTIGQRLSEDLSLVYSMNLANSTDQLWIADYNLTRRLTTRVTRQEDNSVRMGLQHDLRFGDIGAVPEASGPRVQRRVRSISFESIDANLASKFKVKPGERYDFFKIRKGIERIEHALAGNGRLEARVRVDRQIDGEEVDLTVKAEPGPLVDFAFDGFTAPASFQKRVAQVWGEGVFEVQRAQDAVLELRKQMVGRGFLDARIEYEISSDEGSKKVRFTIAPGERYAEARPVFEGAEALSTDVLRKSLEQANLLDSLYTEPAEAIEYLGNLFRLEGYLDVQIEEPRLETNAAAGSGRLVIAISEGPRYRLTDVEISGNRAVSSEDLLGSAGARPGQTYDPRLLQQILTAIEERYWKEGFNDALITLNANKKGDAAEVAIQVRIEENQQGVVERVEVEGVRNVSAELVRGRLGIKPGEVLDFEQVSDGRRALYQVGAFSMVDVSYDPLATPSEAGRKPLRMRVRVREVKPFEVRYGGFYDTERGPGAIADFTNRNTLGSARVLGLRTRYDSDVKEARAYISQPLLRSFPIQSTVLGFVRRERAADFVTDRVGFSLVQETRWKKSYILNYGYRFEKTHTFETEPDPFFPFDVRLNVAPLTMSFTRETRDAALDATRGSFWSNTLAYAPSVLGSDVRFVRYSGQFYKYIALGKPRPVPFQPNAMRPRLVYAGGVRAGLGWGLGGQTLIPSERFFAGGGTSVRGFAQDSLGPRTFLGDFRGGDAMLVINNELRFPIAGMFDGVAFVDLGNVYLGASDFDPLDVRKSGGFGLRVRTPYFLLRADYGFKLDRKPDEPAGAFFFSIGQAF